MKDDPIFRLVKESKLETSSAFTEATMEKIERRLESRMKMKIYLLMISVSVLIVLTVFLLISSGFKYIAFGFAVNLPKIVTILIVNLIGYFSIRQLVILLNSGLRRFDITTR